MPRWDSVLETALRDSSEWVTISQLRTLARNMYTSQPTSRTPRPSAPCVKAWLIRRIERRITVGMLGARGAAFFVNINNIQRQSSTSAIVRPLGPRSGRHSAIRRLRDFNSAVEAALRDGSPLPMPFQDYTSQEEDANTHEVPSGEIDPEPIREVNNFCQVQQEFSLPVRQRLDALRTQQGESTFGSKFPPDLRPHLTEDDITESMEGAFEDLVKRAKARSRKSPASLESEYYLRQEDKEKGHLDEEEV